MRLSVKWLSNQRCHPASSFTNNFKDTSHHEVQEKQGKFCHPQATPWGLSCHSEHALATLAREISKQYMWFASLMQKRAVSGMKLFHLMFRELHCFCELFQGTMSPLFIESRFVYHSNPTQMMHPKNH